MESCYSIQEQLLAAQHALDHWWHIEILTCTYYKSLQTFHKKCINSCLMQDIDHYIPAFIYHHDLLKKVLYASSHMFSLRKEKALALIEWFYSIQDILTAEAKVPSAQVRNDISVHRLVLQHPAQVPQGANDSDDERKEESLRYELQNGILYNSVLNTPVIITFKDLMATIEAVHNDSVRRIYDVASDEWKEGRKILDSCRSWRNNDGDDPPLRP